MGSKIKAKYDGACKFCGEDWVVGDDLYYQKNPKAICSEESCFNQQGGKVSTFSFNKNTDVIVTRIPDIEVGDSVKQVAEILQQYVVVAHHLTKSMYPSLNEETHTFGQIRSKLTDQILSVCHLTKQ